MSTGHRPSTRQRQRAVTRLADTVTALLPNKFVTFTTGVVASVTAGAADDGTSLTTVDTLGDAGVAMARLASYTPVVGNTVMIVVVDGAPTILGARVGSPIVEA